MRYTRIAVVGIVVLMITFGITCAVEMSEASKYTKEADVLKSLHLFKGMEHGYELDKTFTRAQGAIMLLRLTGKEKAAEIAKLKSPFNDVKDGHWSAVYIAYAHQLGIVKGTSISTYSPELPMTAKEFLTLVLRALNYQEAEPHNSFELARKSGLLTKAEQESIVGLKVFKRDEMVLISYKALSTKLENWDITLLQKLVDVDQAVSREKAMASGLYEPKLTKTSNDPMDQIERAIRDALRKK